MYKAAVRWMIRRNVRALGTGDPGPLMSGYSDDAVLVFPGPSSWGGTYKGKDAIREFMVRFIADGLVGEAQDILVNGPPWRTRVAVLLAATASDASGTTVYENRAMLFARAKWGKITYQEDFEDTHKSVAFEEYLKATRGAP